MLYKYLHTTIPATSLFTLFADYSLSNELDIYKELN